MDHAILFSLEKENSALQSGTLAKQLNPMLKPTLRTRPCAITPLISKDLERKRLWGHPLSSLMIGIQQLRLPSVLVNIENIKLIYLLQLAL